MAQLDVLIRDATVYDGLTTQARRIAVGIRADRIVYVGKPPVGAVAGAVVDGRGLVLAPGFIDSHASTGLGYLLPHAADNKLFQGVTTEVAGNCGASDAPVADGLAEATAAACGEMGVPCGWRTVGEWFARLGAYGLPIHFATHVGHSTLRAGAAGQAAEIGEAALRRIDVALDAALDDGVLGMSTGLVYAPGSFAATSELVRLARRVARRGGIYASHLRDEREGLEDAVAEALEIGRAADLPVLISHLKAAERPNWGKLPGVVASIDAARAAGRRVSFEVYPYTAVSTKLRTFLPKDLLEGGVAAMAARLVRDEPRAQALAWLERRGTDFETMTLITESLPGVRGKSLAEVGRERSIGGADAVVEVLLADPEAWIVYDCLSEDDLLAALSWDGSIVCSDSWSYPWNAPRQIGDPHPRSFGAFARLFERYVLGDERLSFGEAVRKVTSLPADFLGLEGRGRIAEGAWADLVLLDPARLRETATYREPRRLAEGVLGVWVNGVRVLDDGKIDAGKRPGRLLRRSRGTL